MKPVLTHETRRTTTRSLGVSLALALLAVALLLFVPSVLASVEKSNPAHPRITDGLLTLDVNDLQAEHPPFLSGLRNNKVVSSYESTDVELLNCTDAYVVYSIDGSEPATSPHRAPLTCDSLAPIPNTRQTFQGSIPADMLRQAGGGRVLFQIVVLVLPDTIFVDNNRGDYYAYQVDTTRPAVASWFPSAMREGSGLWSASRDPRTPLSFRVQDHADQSALATVDVKIDGVNATHLFDCRVTSPHIRDCALDYSRAASDFAWTEGNHRILVAATDVTGNPIDDATSAYTLRFDTAPPSIQGIRGRAQNQIASSSSGLLTAARGANVTVEARIDDPSMDVGSTESVFAQLVSEDGVFTSRHVPLVFDPEARVWWSEGVPVPPEWPAVPMSFGARVTATDRAGNVRVQEAPQALFQLDPEPPSIVLLPTHDVMGNSGLRIQAFVTDEGTGVDPSSVRIRFASIAAAGSPAVEPTTTTYRESRTSVQEDGAFVGNIPAGPDGSMVGFYLVARDRAGGETQTETRLVSVDAVAPDVTEVGPQLYRAAKGQTFRATVDDTGSGLQPSSVTFRYRVGGVYRDVGMARGPSGAFEATVDLMATDGRWVAYYMEASDVAGNVGRAGQPGSPLTVRIDTVPPAVLLQVPEETDGEPFVASWRGSDMGSGVRGFTVEARIRGMEWFRLSADEATSAVLCPAGPSVVEFRASATDVAGNTGVLPSEPMASTAIRGSGCAQQLLVSDVTVGRTLLDAVAEPHAVLSWRATSIEHAVPDESLRIELGFSPDAGSHYFPFQPMTLEPGSATFRVGTLDACSVCRFRVVATSLAGSTASAESGLFSVRGGDPARDRDANQLPDLWELRYARSLGLLQASADNDGDRLVNEEEAALGTNPYLFDTDGDGTSDAVEIQGGGNPLEVSSPAASSTGSSTFSSVYWVLPATFAVVVVIFLVGIGRRW